MMARLTILEGEPPVGVGSAAEVDELIAKASSDAQAKGRANVVFVRAQSGNEISIVVGDTETVLGFTYGHHDPPYYVSKGSASGVEPVFTAYVSMTHHTEYPRNWVIQWNDGLNAVREFIESGELPTTVTWQEV